MTDNSTTKLAHEVFTPQELQRIAGVTLDELADLKDDAPAPAGRDEEAATEYRQTPHVPLDAKVDRADLAARFARADEAEQEINRLFDEGEITTSEFRLKLRQIDDFRSDAKWQEQKADLADDMRKTAEDQAWFETVSQFMTEGPAATIANSKAALTAFDAHVRQVTRDEPQLTDRAQLEKAWKFFKSDMAGAGVTITDANRRSRRDDSYETAQALGSMGGGRGAADFAALDRALERGDGVTAERLMAGMTPDQLDAYSRS